METKAEEVDVEKEEEEEEEGVCISSFRRHVRNEDEAARVKDVT